MDDCYICGDPLDLVELYELDLNDPGGPPICGDCRENREEEELTAHLLEMAEYE